MKFSNELAKLNYAVALDRLGGDEELLSEVARLFLDEYPTYLQQIEEAAAKSNAEALQHAAHTLKGSISNFGADEVYNAALVLETMGRQNNLDQVGQGVQQLQLTLQEVLPALKTLAAASE